MKVETKLKAATPPSTAKRTRENDGGVVKAGGNERVGDRRCLHAPQSGSVSLCPCVLGLFTVAFVFCLLDFHAPSTEPE